MSDIIRTALRGGGSIRISIDTDRTGDFSLLVTESWERLTGVQRAKITAEELAAAADPDAVIQEKLTELADQHINWKAQKLAAQKRRKSEGEKES